MLEALAAVQRKKPATFGAPGHHSGKGATRDVTRLIGARVFEADVLTLKGVDDRAERRRVRQTTEQLVAEAWGVDRCYLSSNGSTLSGQAAILACAGPGDTILMARNVHKSTVSAVIYAGLTPVILEPDQDAAWNIEHGVSIAEVERKLAAHPECKAAFIVSPTYYGVTSDVAGIAAACHRAGKPLIVDEAWGAMFPFSSDLPEPAIRLGADFSVASVHKTMGALTQASIMLHRSDLVDADRLDLAYDLLETTSPSVPIFASIDATRRHYALNGGKLVRSMLRLADAARKRLARIDGVRVMGAEVLNGAGAFGWDRSKLLFDIGDLGVNGYEADDWLMTERRVTAGLSDERRLLAIFGAGSGMRDGWALTSGVKALARRARKGWPGAKGAPADLPPLSALSTELAMRPSDAFFGRTENVPLGEAAGRIVAEMISPYPPGIPRLIPGERITPGHVSWLERSKAAGAFALDPADLTWATVRVAV